MSFTKGKEICGLLNINKPKGLTSHDVIVKLRQLLKIRKIGHTGTLDPQATGVLMICLGKATKFASLLSSKDKEYTAGIKIGITTDTQDVWGIILKKEECSNLNMKQIKKAFLHFTGEISQVPPMYSAVKYKGKRLYELARKGLTVERTPRKVSINFIERISYKEDIYPEIIFKVSCSSGTYIRTLCEDIGKYLGYGACMFSLVRTRVGLYSLEDSLTLEELVEVIKKDVFFKHLIPMDKI
ncbi:MAG: tRNA pseudouridine(55) synthase TruB [bacterium]|nr:tRNA pseudouridine(55) synthase TruB [bacterium]